jgi:hypothetical protein
MKSLSRLALVALCGLASASAQDFFSELFNPLAPFPPPSAEQGAPPGNEGIQSHIVRSATSEDGLTWTVDEGTRPHQRLGALCDQ